MNNEKTTWGLLRRFMRGGGKLILISLLLYTITIGMNLFPPLFQQIFTDHIITGKNPEWFWPLILLYTALFILELVAWLVLNGHRRELDMRFCRINVVSTTKDKKYGHAQREAAPGLYVLTHSSTKDKKKMLDKINKALNMGWRIEIVK